MRSLPTLVCDLLDVVGRAYDGINHVATDDVHERMFDPCKRDHPLVAAWVVAQTPCDVIANLNLHTGLAEVDIAAVIQFKAHHAPRLGEAAPYRIDMPIRGEREVA